MPTMLRRSNAWLLIRYMLYSIITTHVSFTVQTYKYQIPRLLNTYSLRRNNSRNQELVFEALAIATVSNTNNHGV